MELDSMSRQHTGKFDLTIRELQKEIYKSAVEKGWWDNPDRVFGEVITLIHCELSEAFEEYRNSQPFGDVRIENGKPEGIPVEMADAIIRILDWAESEGVDMEAVIQMKMNYNRTRPHRHGGKLA